VCLTDLLEFFEEVYETIDEGKLKVVIYLDFAKEFDKVYLIKDWPRVVNMWRLEGRL